jgi:hypothetical protein
MRTVVLKKDGKSIDMFEAMDIIREIETFTLENIVEDDGINYYIMFFHFELDGKHVYLVFADPTFFGIKQPINSNYAVIKIKELNLEVSIEVDTPKAVFYSYSIENKPMESLLMRCYLLSKFLDLENYEFISEPDTVFISEKE